MAHRVEHTMNQVSPQPTGPSFKKPFTIAILLSDELYQSYLTTLISLIGSGHVFGQDQPINFRFIINPTSLQSSQQQSSTPNNEQSLFLSSGFMIPHTLQFFTQDDINSLFNQQINLFILSTKSQDIVKSIATTFSTSQINNNTKVFIISPDIITTCTLFQTTSKLPSSLIHGFALHYQTFMLSQLVTQLNEQIQIKKLQSKLPFIDVQSIKNAFITTIPTTATYNISHAVITNYPIPGRITPFVAVVTKLLPNFKLINSFSTDQYDQLSQNLLSPIPSLVATHLKYWFSFSPRSTFFSACVCLPSIESNTSNTTFNIQPISTYYGNTASSVTFDLE